MGWDSEQLLVVILTKKFGGIAAIYKYMHKNYICTNKFQIYIYQISNDLCKFGLRLCVQYYQMVSKLYAMIR